IYGLQGWLLFTMVVCFLPPPAGAAEGDSVCAWSDTNNGVALSRQAHRFDTVLYYQFTAIGRRAAASGLVGQDWRPSTTGRPRLPFKPALSGRFQMQGLDLLGKGFQFLEQMTVVMLPRMESGLQERQPLRNDLGQRARADEEELEAFQPALDIAMAARGFN